MEQVMKFEQKFFDDHRSKVPKGAGGLVVRLAQFQKWVIENRVPKGLIYLLMARIPNNESNGYLIDIDF